MTFDVELFLRDKIEQILKDNPDYGNINIKTVITIRDGKVTFTDPIFD
jgi:hypothetical protein